MTLTVQTATYDGSTPITFTQGYKLLYLDWNPFGGSSTLYYENDDSVTLDDTVDLLVHSMGDAIEDGAVFQFPLFLVGFFLYTIVVHN